MPAGHLGVGAEPACPADRTRPSGHQAPLPTPAPHGFSADPEHVWTPTVAPASEAPSILMTEQPGAGHVAGCADAGWWRLVRRPHLAGPLTVADRQPGLVRRGFCISSTPRRERECHRPPRPDLIPQAPGTSPGGLSPLLPAGQDHGWTWVHVAPASRLWRMPRSCTEMYRSPPVAVNAVAAPPIWPAVDQAVPPLVERSTSPLAVTPHSRSGRSQSSSTTGGPPAGVQVCPPSPERSTP